jgi:hypothetical protein
MLAVTFAASIGVTALTVRLSTAPSPHGVASPPIAAPLVLALLGAALAWDAYRRWLRTDLD